MRFSRPSHTAPILIVHSILFLFFFQLLSDFVASIYAFGLLGTDIPPEIACVLLLFAPALLLFFRRGLPDKGLSILGAGVLLCRVVEVMLDTRGKMFIAGLGVAVFLVFLPALLGRQQRKPHSQELGVSLGLGVVLSIMLRALGSGADLTSIGMFKGIDWGLALLAGLFLVRSFAPGSSAGPLETPNIQSKHASAWKTIGLSLGITSAFILLYFAFTSPAVIARWTGSDYLRIIVVLVLALEMFITILMRGPWSLMRIKPGILLGWNLLFVLCLTLTILAQQVSFPSAPDRYPFTPPAAPWGDIPLILMLLLSPIVLLDFTLFGREIVAERPSTRLMGGSFALSSLFMLVMIFAQVFTTVYDYIPVAGPLLRDKFWLVFLAAGLVMALPTLLIRKASAEMPDDPQKAILDFPVTAALLLVAIAAIAGTQLTAASPSTPSATRTDPLRVLTYNIQQGYNKDGQQYLEGPQSQLGVLRKMMPDVIGLQETDTARISGGNLDIVRFMADRLEMFSYYGPSTVAGTFGIALLSRYPIQNPQTYYMYSSGEQTAVITAQITAGGKTYNVFVTHLGNGGPIIQLEQVLQLVRGKDNILLMGDFNFKPGTDQYRLATSGLSDAWLLRGAVSNPAQEFDPNERIDYLYVSSETQVLDSQYLSGGQSDHPALVSDLEP